MNLAYITTYDLADRQTWAATQLGLCQAGAAIAQQLTPLATQTIAIGKLHTQKSPITRLKWLFYRKFQQKDYYTWAEPAVVRGYGQQVSRALVRSHRQTPIHTALCIENALAIATVQPPNTTQLALWTDAPLISLVGLYPYMSNLCRETLHHVRHWEASALERCRWVIFASEWAATVARREYPAVADKIRVIPWGANWDNPPDRATVTTAIAQRSDTQFNLLWIGYNWQRKGGAIALETLEHLHMAGIPAHLTIIGATPTLPNSLQPWVTVLGKLAKENPDDRLQLEQHLSQSHVLFLPTRAETFGHVFCEAAAFGVPSVTYDVGGVGTAVATDRTGYTLPLTATAADFAAQLQQFWADKARRIDFSIAARSRYETLLNWQTACQSAWQLLTSSRP